MNKTMTDQSKRKKKTPGEMRQEAVRSLEDFCVFLNRGAGAVKRRSLSPARALSELRKDDVRNLLPPRRWKEYERAAKNLI